MSRSAGLVIWTNNRQVYNSATDNKENKTRKVNQKRQIVNEIFISLSEVTNDDFWKQRFMKFAKNILPDHFTFIGNEKDKSGVFHYKINSKLKNVSIELDENKLNPDELIEFLNKKGIYSPEDERRMEENKVVQEKTEYVSWSCVKNKYTKNSLIRKFRDKLIKEHNLKTNKEKDSLWLTLNIGFISQYFNDNTVIMENNEIHSVKNLIYENKLFKIDTSCKMKKIKNVTKKDKMSSNTHTYNNFTGYENDIVITSYSQNFNLIDTWCSKMEEMRKKYR